MVKYMLCFESVGGNDQAVEDLVLRKSGCASPPLFKAAGLPKRGIAQDRLALIEK